MNKRQLSTEASTQLCTVVNSRITLTGAQPLANVSGAYRFLVCSNMDNCYNRPDIVEQIPACRLHEHYSDIG